jgi:hypothetical protein
VNSTLTGPVATYLAQVRAELSDLPPGELADVLEDVTGHLTEVAAEFEDEPTAAALQDRLGTPRQYADELRTAAGYPPRKAQPKVKSGAETALRWGIVAAVVGPFFLLVGLLNGSEETVFFGVIGLVALGGAAFLGVRALHGNDPSVVLHTTQGSKAAESIRTMIDQIPPNVRHELVTIGQPVWWVARGLVGGGAMFGLSGASAVAVVGALAGAAVSVWVGRRTQQDRRWLWYVVPLNLVAAIIVPAWLAFGFVGTSYGVFANGDYRDSGSSSYIENGLTLDGRPISNIYPFDEQGKPLKARLYDQDGNPINLQLQDCAASYNTERTSRDPVSNLFPQATISDDGSGYTDAETCKDTDKAPFVPPPAPATTPASTGTPSTGPTASPSGTPPPSSTPSSKPGATLTITPTR